MDYIKKTKDTDITLEYKIGDFGETVKPLHGFACIYSNPKDDLDDYAKDLTNTLLHDLNKSIYEKILYVLKNQKK